MICRRLIWLLPVLLPAVGGEIRADQNGPLEGPSSTNVWNRQLVAEMATLFQQLPAPVIHEAGLTPIQTAQQSQSDARYQQLVREKLQRQWFAALVTTEPAEPYSIAARFGSWREMTEFLAEKQAVVDVWAYGEAGQGRPRRIPAFELDALKRQRREQPTFLTVTYRDDGVEQPETYRLEFGFQAADQSLNSIQAYQRHRSIEVTAQQILAAKNTKGLPDALAQWTLLQNQVRQQKFSILDMPALPTDSRDLFVAVEFTVDEQNNFSNAVRMVRDSEVARKVIDGLEVLYVRPTGVSAAQEVIGFRQVGPNAALQPATNAILGQDTVELRVKNPAQPDPRKWNVLEFGEPELLKQSALAHFAQLNAYLERKRKHQAMKQANVALVAEPIIAGLNIGGGIGALGFPAGDAARLLYNLISWGLISDVPTTKQMRELFALMAARDRNPAIKVKPEHFLTQADIRALKEEGRKLSDLQVETYLQQMNDDDVRAMLRLARQGMIDARITTFLNILTSAFKVDGISDEAGPIRNIFNNVRFAVNGDINISTLLLIALGRKDMTGLSGISLRQLSQGNGPNRAWLQFLVVSVDIRAVLNTIVRLTKRTEAKKELEKPFAYAPRLSEVAAYEVRIFGFPLLLFYKRGLIKADRDAYEHDYAYGLCGVSVVEHFPTRQDMEAEIRAGRMFPLGLVKVPTANGGWKETDLVVYAHRAQGCRKQGNTTLVIYGLKAYADYSELIGRELLRFKQFEQGLREGAVIEQRVWQQASASETNASYEPVIHVGSNAVQQVYSPLLGALLELRRYAQRQSWGLQNDPAELEVIKRRISTLGIDGIEPDALIEIDPHGSSFMYRRRVGRASETIRVTSIPSLQDINRELQKAEDGKFIEELRAQTAEGQNQGIVLLNEALNVAGYLEAGPLLRDSEGQVLGAGVLSKPEDLADILQQIDRMPVIDRARLRANHFAGTPIELALKGLPQRTVFLTIEFPLGQTWREWTNPLTGDLERFIYTNGVWTGTITDQRILEIAYDAAGMETGSRTYANRGDRQAPIRGVLLEQTRTVESWLRDLSQPALDPYQPLNAKLHINYVTGLLTRETYGLFNLPVETVDDLYITTNRYTPYGLFESAMVFDNGLKDADFQRSVANKVSAPMVGAPRFQLTSRLPQLLERHDLSDAGYQTIVERTNLITGLNRTETLDNTHEGRKVQEIHSDPFDGTKSFATTVTWEYSNDFELGLVPRKTVTRSSPSGAQLSEASTVDYDPLKRQLTDVEVAYTGKRQTNTYDHRWEGPVNIESFGRRTSLEYNRTETTNHAITTVTETGETLREDISEYQLPDKTWRVTRQQWYRLGVPSQVETNTYSAFGLLIRSRADDSLETRPTYTPEAMELASQTFTRNSLTGSFDILARQQDDFQWQNGGCNARVRIFVDGSVVDEYRRITDEQGRPIQDAIRTWPQVELRTVLKYEGQTERVLESQALQNGQLRATYRPLREFKSSSGDWLLPVEILPAWGLASTNTYRLSDPSGRVVSTDFENHERSRVTDWFPGTAIARSSELLDRHGRVKERHVKRLNSTMTAGLPLDQVTRYQVSPWGAQGVAEQRALLRGTDLTVYAQKAGAQIFFDLAKPFDSPQYAVDPDRVVGLRVSIGGTIKSNVTAVYSARFGNRSESAAGTSPEPVLELAGIDLTGFFWHQFATHTFDRGGHLLEDAGGQIRSLGGRGYSDDALLSEMGRAKVTHRTGYRYQSGGFQQKTDGVTEAALVFTSQTNATTWTVNDGGWREWPTEINIFRREDLSPESESPFFQVRRVHSPRWFQSNRYAPGATNVWMQWTATELNNHRAPLFDTEIIYNAAGEPTVSVAHKLNSQGRPAEKVIYQVPYPQPEDWRLTPMPANGRVELRLSASRDLSRSEFVGLCLDTPAAALVRLKFEDRSRRSATVAYDPAQIPRNAIPFWPVGFDEVSLWPSEVAAERAVAVGAPGSLVQAGKVFVASIAELAGTGLDPGNISGITLEVTSSGTPAIRSTEIFQLAYGPSRVSKARPGFVYDLQPHSSGLQSYRRTKSLVSSREARAGQGWKSVLKYDNISTGSVNPRSDPPYYPVLTLADDSDPDAPRPLYTLAVDDGRFMAYFETTRTGNISVYTVVNGFDTPKLETYRAGVLDDEFSPGILSQGYGYYVTVPLAKSSGWWAGVLAGLHNRCVASAFSLGADYLMPWGRGGDGPSPRPVSSHKSPGDGPSPPLGQASQPNPNQKPAAAQAHDIEQLPTLAEALLPRRLPPWSEPGFNNRPTAQNLLNRTNAIRELYAQSGAYLGAQGLIPTAPGTQVARYVDTVQEGRIIELAVQLHRPDLTKPAAELLSFYWDKSEGGTRPLHAYYDASTGASLTKRPEDQQATDSEMTASAQLAIAQAAFCLATVASDTNALTFGKNLLQLLFNDFRPDTNELTWPRGIAEHRVTRLTSHQVVKKWRDAKTFSVGTNARAYLLLARLAEQLRRAPGSPVWNRLVLESTDEQAAWLTNRILPFVQRTGVVPKGVFELQDVKNEQTVLALDRWTTTADWLSFIEAANRLGIGKDLTRAWLGNLARAHGVFIDGVWGLDWTIPIRRPDAISPELTSGFLRLATLLGHQSAAQVASRSLTQLRQEEGWPVLVSAASTDVPLKTGEGDTIYPTAASSAGHKSSRWPRTLGVYADLQDSNWETNRWTAEPMRTPSSSPRDITQFLAIAAGFYLSIILAALCWWALSWVRRRRTLAKPRASPGLLVSETVMAKGEERWAKRVLGVRTPAHAECSRYSNGAIEQNFHLQLRAIYKLVLEWRRQANDWSEDDERLCEAEDDPWLNGMDEFAVMVGIYSRWVVKAGRKDGGRKPDVLKENEDSNHIWSRLVMYFSESHLRLLGLIKEFKANPAAADVLGVNDQIELVLRTMGVRARPSGLDARVAFDAPNNPSAMDLLLLQSPAASLTQIVQAMEQKLDIPAQHVVSFIEGYKSFKEREQLWPIHPYVLEMAKILPHFLLMGWVALIWYNNQYRGLLIREYLRESATRMALDWHSLIWAVPLLVGFGLSAAARAMQVYRYRWASQTRGTLPFALDADLTSLFGRGTEIATPAMRTEGWWNPVLYQRAGWVFRAVGLALLAVSFFKPPEGLEPPSFVTFMFVKGLLGIILLMESACLLGPLLISRFSTWLEDYVTARPTTWPIIRWLNQLNIPPTRPASLIWLSIKYHFQPSVPTGGALCMVRAMAFYVGFSTVFFAIGSYMLEQALEIWFQDAYRSGRDVGLVLGGFLFWNTMYLLRFGLFVWIVAIGSAAAIYPFRVAGGLLALVCLGLQLFSPWFSEFLSAHMAAGAAVLVLGLALMAYESEILAWLTARSPWARRNGRQEERQVEAIERMRRDPNRALGVVYMSGDDLSFYKLSPDLLMTRLKILREQLGSSGVELLSKMSKLPGDEVLERWFGLLYDLEKRYEVTLWHPIQLVVSGEQPRLAAELGLSLVVENTVQRDELLLAWHTRRWLVTMMSTAGHSQDTAINLVDIALALQAERLSGNVVFYLIQNKYDNNDNNRPAQAAYDKGELGQRNKLARLLMELAPGCRAYSINDWTPFGFKAGGLVGMDLVYEETLKLTNMLVVDRNATANDVDALLDDLKLALSDPGVVIVLPGRSTTNTRTPIGQSSQLVEEGHRAFTRGVMILGGSGSETLGTGWGNIQAVYYGRVQKALCDLNTSKMPLTTPAERGASFGDRYEGLIGFGPHAIGISEDIWGVTQAAHNALALGYSISFERSKALWHKIRETWSHAEWLAAFPRWSGGYVQMMLDPLMQRINDSGSLSVFAKEIRANGGRFFLGAPAALLSILLMPLAIMADVSPFVQILILLWNLGLLMNQVLTVLGFIAYLEGAGFNRITALAGLATAGIAAATQHNLARLALPLLVLGFLSGGFALGLGRWLYYRGRDLVLFGPQLVIHTLGQVVRQSLEFVLSGASANDARGVNIAFRAWVGPREDRPFERYQNFVNLRTVVWGVGLTSMLLDLFALANLDFLNVLLLLPSLMFSVSTLVGPFVMQPKPGKSLGWLVCIPKALGWLASFGFYMIVARLISAGGWFQDLAVLLCIVVFGRVASAGLRYVSYSRRLARVTEALARKIVSAGSAQPAARKLAEHIMRDLAADIAKSTVALQKSGLTAEAQAAVLTLVRDRALPLVKQPLTDLETKSRANPRMRSEWSRSFVLGLFTFIWFFVVPMPGLLVFTAPGGFRISVSPGTVLNAAMGVLATVLGAYLLSLILDWWERHSHRGGLADRIQLQYRLFQSVAHRLTPLQNSRIYAMFTDVQTYFDQQSYAYARRSLSVIERALKGTTDRQLEDNAG